MNRCLICFKTVEFSLTRKKVCNRCLSEFEIINKQLVIDDVEVLIIYKYNDFFKELLYRYKGCYDYLLKNAFFNDEVTRLKKKYKGRKIICAPSSKKSDKKRGYRHVKEIAKLLDLEIIDCLSKKKEYKQSDQKYEDREKIQNVIQIDKKKVKGIKKVLIMDDVTTSLSTIRTIIRLLPTEIDKKVLILASNCRFLENEKN